MDRESSYVNYPWGLLGSNFGKLLTLKIKLLGDCNR